MYYEKKDNILSQIKSTVGIYDILSKYQLNINHSGMANCPFHKDKDASLKVYPSTNTFYCFGCGKSGDIVQFVQFIENCSFAEALNKIKDSKMSHIDTAVQKEEKPALKPEEIKRFILMCQKNVSKTNYWNKRGLTNETQSRFRLGFDELHNSVVIPYNRSLTYYQSRNIVTRKFYKPKRVLAGPEPIFNANALKLPTKVFVVESPICAMSIMQYGYQAIATGGAQGWHKVPKFPMNTDCVLVLCLDNDATGRNAQKKLKTALPLKCVEYNIADECKDPNELMNKDKNRFVHNLQLAITNTKNITIERS